MGRGPRDSFFPGSPGNGEVIMKVVRKDSVILPMWREGPVRAEVIPEPRGLVTIRSSYSMTFRPRDLRDALLMLFWERPDAALDARVEAGFLEGRFTRSTSVEVWLTEGSTDVVVPSTYRVRIARPTMVRNHPRVEIGDRDVGGEGYRVRVDLLLAAMTQVGRSGKE